MLSHAKLTKTAIRASFQAIYRVKTLHARERCVADSLVVESGESLQQEGMVLRNKHIAYIPSTSLLPIPSRMPAGGNSQLMSLLEHGVS